MEGFITEFDDSSGCITEVSKTYTGDMIFHQTFNSKTIICIGSRAFQECSSLFVDLSDTNIKEIKSNAFSYSKTERILFPESLKKLGDNLFLYSALQSAHIPRTTTDINIYAFNYAKIKYISVDENNEKYSSVKGFLMNKEKTMIYATPRNITDETDFPFFTGISRQAMSGASLKSFVGNSNFSDVDSCAFHGLKYCKLLDLSRTSITVLPQMFAYGSLIKKIILPSNLQKISSQAFDVIGFKMIIIPPSVTVIKDCAFDCNATFTVVYLGSLDYSNSNIFGSLNKQNIKVYVTDFYEQNRFGNVNVIRNWIGEKISCEFKRNTFSAKNCLCILVLYSEL